MAEALVGVLLDRLASITLNKVDQELNLVIGVDKEIKNLTRTLKAIKAVLEDAEQRQVQEASVRHWLSNLKEVSEEIDDVLDEWSYEVLKQQIVKKQQGEEGGENAPVAKKKVCFSIPSPCSPCCCFDGVNQVVHRHDIAKKIKDLSERLALIDAERHTYHLQFIERRSEQLIKHQKTSSGLDITFGLENERESLVSKLLNDGGEEESVPLIIPIIGMGGVGKTTLCQLVFNDERVIDHFDNRIWIWVPEPFEDIHIVSAIAQGFGIRDHPMSNALETYSQYIISCIKKTENEEKKRDKTKFLIVLDGVWNPTESQWEQVIKPLREGARGSRILVTTRIEKVAVMMGVASNVIHLEMLSEDDCRSLFFHFATFGREIKNHRMLAVGDEIVRKCKGLPLAAKTLGRFMRNKNSLSQWEGVLNSRLWKLKEFEQNVFEPLLLSYYDLTSTIRRCLLYCAIFPKDYQIDRLELIRLWMSQDYLCATEEIEDIYMVGEACFDDLVMRSFFQDLEKDNEGNIECCKMHDVVHDLLQYLTIHEIFTLDATHARPLGRRFSLPDNNVRHISIIFDSDSIYFPSENLRTVILDGKWVFGIESLIEQKSLRTLNMSRFWGVIPNEIGELIHLRYLKLSGNPSEKLPETLCNLYNLQTLIVTFCSSLRKLPHGMGKLINLKHLDVRGCDSLDLSGVKRAGLRILH